jgi:hypothetical protein
MFRVYRSMNDTIHYQPIGFVRELLFRDFSVVPGNRYYYYVKTVSQIAPYLESPRSNVVDILIPLPVPPRRGFISGTVTDDSTGAPIRRVRMRFFRLPSTWCTPGYVLTDSLGHYRAVLDTGRYIVKAEPLCASAIPCYYPEYYNNVREPPQATIITVGDNTNFTANFGLTRIVPPSYAHMRGMVRDTLNHPLARARLSIMHTLQEMSSISANGGTIGSAENMILEGVGYAMGVVETRLEMAFPPVCISILLVCRSRPVFPFATDIQILLATTPLTTLRQASTSSVRIRSKVLLRRTTKPMRVA